MRNVMKKTKTARAKENLDNLVEAEDVSNGFDERSTDRNFNNLHRINVTFTLFHTVSQS